MLHTIEPYNNRLAGSSNSSAPLPHKARAVSLAEVLTVLAIVMFLLALLVPGMGKAKEQARRVQCACNLKQWAFAVQSYRDDNFDYLLKEGTTLPPSGGLIPWYKVRGTWFNELPPYLDMLPYGETEGVNVRIRDYKNGHYWTCPSKAMSDANVSQTEKNQFHYAMNQILDGMGPAPAGSDDTPGYPDPPVARAVPARRFAKHPNTVILMEIAPNSPAGNPRTLATEHFRGFDKMPLAKFHGNFANLLLLDGRVVDVTAEDVFAPVDYLDGKIRWENPKVYWGYPPPEWARRIQP